MNYQTPIKELNNLLKSAVKDEFIALILFGSVARGTDNEDSDIDILVIVSDDSSKIRNIIIECTFNINLDFDILISPIIMSRANYENSLFKETQLYRNIQAEGVVL